MGNLSQVFISNALTALDGTQAQFGGTLAGADPADDVGIFTLGPGTPEYKQTALYETAIATTGAFVKTDDTAAAEDPVLGQTTIANPVWLYHSFQVVQRALTGAVLQSPIIATSAVKRISHTPYTAWVGHQATCVDATFNSAGAVDGNEYNFKFVIRAVPVNQSQFYNSTNASLYSNVFPLGAFNTTNHKVINMSVNISDVSDADGGTNEADIQAAIAAHGLLKDLVSAADVGNDIVITSLHPGLIFDLLVENVTQDTDPIVAVATGQVLGVGNDWQVADDEIRCRSRYGDHNRMYLPTTQDTYVTAGSAYDKIVIEYATPNWPNGAGILPAGGVNQAVIYYTNESAAPAANANEFATLFGYTQHASNTHEFVWAGAGTSL